MGHREKYFTRPQQRLTAQRKIAKAKAILMRSPHILDEEAYDPIRSRALTKRATTEEIADAVIKANEILGMHVKTWKRD